MPTAPAEELGAGDLSLALHLLTPAMAGLPIALFGTDEQKQRWLPALAADEFPKLTAAWGETHWDFDPLTPRTLAVRQGDRLNRPSDTNDGFPRLPAGRSLDGDSGHVT